jgi:hypothetical protein
MIKLDESVSVTKKTAIEAASISFTNAKDSIKQSEPQKAEKYSDAAPGPLRSTRISSFQYQRSRVKALKTSIKFNPVSPFLVKTVRFAGGSPEISQRSWVLGQNAELCIWGYTRQAAIKPNKHRGKEMSASTLC